jgi:hypothetical protein
MNRLFQHTSYRLLPTSCNKFAKLKENILLVVNRFTSNFLRLFSLNFCIIFFKNTFRNSTPRNIFSIPEFRNSTPRNIFSIPEFRNSIPRNIFSIPEFRNSTPRNIFSIPEFRNSTPRNIFSIPEFRNSTPRKFFVHGWRLRQPVAFNSWRGRQPQTAKNSILNLTQIIINH